MSSWNGQIRYILLCLPLPGPGPISHESQKSWPRSLENRRKEPNKIGELRLIFTNLAVDESDEILEFPEDTQKPVPVLPFSLDTFRYIQDQLQLPVLQCHTPGSYIRQFRISDGEDTREGTSA